MAADNVSLGTFNLVDLPPSPRGVPQIELTFDIDANGILNVTAKDLGTGKQSKITITASTKLSKEEKERLIRDAEQFSEQDKKKREEVELRNNADSLIYTAEKTKKDLSDKLTQEQNGKIDAEITALKDALASNDFTQVKTKSEELQKTLQDVGTAVYQQAAAEQAKQQQTQSGQQNQEPQGPQDAGPGSERVVDSDDYKVK
jgi:molecular chaperone DnaK